MNTYDLAEMRLLLDCHGHTDWTIRTDGPHCMQVYAPDGQCVANIGPPPVDIHPSGYLTITNYNGKSNAEVHEHPTESIAWLARQHPA